MKTSKNTTGTKNTLFKKITLLSLIASALCLTGCSTPAPVINQEQQQKFTTQKPRSIAVVPVINRSADVRAGNFFMASLTPILAEWGYYVPPVNALKTFLSDQGLSDAALLHQADARKLKDIVNSDAVLFVEIKDWSSQYILLDTTVKINLKYQLRSTVTNDILWEAQEERNVSTGGGGNNLIVALINAAVNKALETQNLITLAGQTTVYSMSQKNFLRGPYLPAAAQN
jgi:hypothetical protein